MRCRLRLAEARIILLAGIANKVAGIQFRIHFKDRIRFTVRNACGHRFGIRCKCRGGDTLGSCHIHLRFGLFQRLGNHLRCTFIFRNSQGAVRGLALGTCLGTGFGFGLRFGDLLRLAAGLRLGNLLGPFSGLGLRNSLGFICLGVLLRDVFSFAAVLRGGCKALGLRLLRICSRCRKAVSFCLLRGCGRLLYAGRLRRFGSCHGLKSRSRIRRRNRFGNARRLRCRKRFRIQFDRNNVLTGKKLFILRILLLSKDLFRHHKNAARRQTGSKPASHKYLLKIFLFDLYRNQTWILSQLRLSAGGNKTDQTRHDIVPSAVFLPLLDLC